MKIGKCLDFIGSTDEIVKTHHPNENYTELYSDEYPDILANINSELITYFILWYEK